jgi:hypothetical protein
MNYVEELNKSSNYEVYYKNNIIKKYICFGFLRDYSEDTLILNLKSFNQILKEEYIIKLCEIINRITPCIYNNLDNTISYTFINSEHKDRYNRNILLLNFIRNLWYTPIFVDYDSIRFFEELNYNDDDPMIILTRANLISCEKTKISPTHCNVHKDCKIKTLKDFNDHNFNLKLNNEEYTETKLFLTK